MYVWICFLFVFRPITGSLGIATSQQHVTSQTQLFAEVNSGNIPPSHAAAVKEKTDVHQVGPYNPRLCVPMEAVNVGAVRAQRKTPCAWASGNTASSLGSAGWKSGRCEGASCQCAKASS